MRKRADILILLIFSLFLSPVNTGAQVVEIRSWLDSMYIEIGEQVKLHLEIKKDSLARVQVGELRDSLNDRIELIGNPLINNGKVNGREVILYIYTLTSFDSGKHDLPPIPVFLSYKDIIDTIYSKPLILEVHVPLVDTTIAIKDIKAPINAPLTFREILPFLGMGVAAVLIVAFLIYMFRRYRKKQTVFTRPEKSLPAHVIAFRELDNLKDEKIWQAGKVKEFYVRLSDIIRVYIEKRYGFTAMEYVTDETLKEFKKVNKDDEVNEMLEEILFTSDMVKFAKGDPLPADNQSNMNNAYLFVEKTKLEVLKSVEELEKENVLAGDPENKGIE